MHPPFPQFPAPAIADKPERRHDELSQAANQELNSAGWIDKARESCTSRSRMRCARWRRRAYRAGRTQRGKSHEAAASDHASVLLAPTLAAAAPPPDLGDFAYRQKPGSQLPLQAVFRDEAGDNVRLLDLLHGKPLVLALVYFHCPNLCGIVRADLFTALGKTGMTAGRDYALVAFSIDPAETSADARTSQGRGPRRTTRRRARAGLAFPDRIGRRRAGRRRCGRHSATASIRQFKQFLHPAGIVFVTPADRLELSARRRLQPGDRAARP